MGLEDSFTSRSSQLVVYCETDSMMNKDNRAAAGAAGGEIQEL